MYDYIKKGDCVNLICEIPNQSIDLTITSPPYDDLRTYNNLSIWDENRFRLLAQELYRVTKQGGVIVWIVNDSTKNGSETLSSFKQALFFKEIGFSVETMIWEKPTFTATGALKYRYGQVFEYMFIFIKGTKPKTFNALKDRKCVRYGTKVHGSVRQKDGSTKPVSSIGKHIKEYGQRFNVWQIAPEMSNNKRCHPAQFPEKLVKDHIISWSNENDVVFDPFLGSGTTAICASQLNRHYIGFEIDENYFKMAEKRIFEVKNGSF